MVKKEWMLSVLRELVGQKIRPTRAKRTPKKTLHAQGLTHGCRFWGGVASDRGEEL